MAGWVCCLYVCTHLRALQTVTPSAPRTQKSDVPQQAPPADEKVPPLAPNAPQTPSLLSPPPPVPPLLVDVRPTSALQLDDDAPPSPRHTGSSSNLLQKKHEAETAASAVSSSDEISLQGSFRTSSPRRKLPCPQNTENGTDLPLTLSSPGVFCNTEYRIRNM
jgi:hypothetical protein